MNDHLPECPKFDVRVRVLYGDQCLCPALRACEARIIGDRVNAIQSTALRSYRAGIAAARGAVANALQHAMDPGYLRDRALDAIDSLMDDSLTEEA